MPAHKTPEQRIADAAKMRARMEFRKTQAAIQEENKKFGPRWRRRSRYESEFYKGLYAPNFIAELAGMMRAASGAKHQTGAKTF